MAEDGKVGSSVTMSLRKKVKSGCRTCKRRKVKCGEEWPACQRCQSAGRVCDGYGVWGGGSQTSSLQPQHQTTDWSVVKSRPVFEGAMQLKGISPIPLLTLPINEKDGFEWFMHRSASKLPGVFVSRHWNTLLFQTSVTEPAIRHAMIALASAHREEVRGVSSMGQEYNDAQAVFTVKQYGMAIKCLQPYLTDSRRTSIHATFISCALFVWTDYLRGHYTNALLHLEHGLNLLHLLESHAGINPQEPQTTYVEGWVLTMFTRLLVQAKLLGQISTFPCRRVAGPRLRLDYDTFRSTHHARRSLEHIMLRAIDIKERSSQYETEMVDYTSAVLLDDQRITQEELHIWSRIYEVTEAKLPRTTELTERFAYGLLRLYYYLTVVLLGTCTDISNEVRFDVFEPVFLDIISYCIETHKLVFPNGKRNIKGHHDPEASSPNSISDIGWVAPLYYTAIKCRNHRIRHQAIQLLGSSPHKEGIWNVDLVTPVACKVASIEEGDFYSSTKEGDKFSMLDIPTNTDLAAVPLPAGYRASKIELVLPADKAGKLLLNCGRKEKHGTMTWVSQGYDLRTHDWTANARIKHNNSISFDAAIEQELIGFR